MSGINSRFMSELSLPASVPLSSPPRRRGPFPVPDAPAVGRERAEPLERAKAGPRESSVSEPHNANSGIAGTFRVAFGWNDDGATDVDIEDYHR